ncbi:MAG: hypothetical protein AB1560_07500 [Pseudomonadota bacterium]
MNAASDAVKQARADLLFQRGDALADGRLGQVDALGGALTRPGFGHGQEGLQGGYIHNLIEYIT